jgi:hypothetical protein
MFRFQPGATQKAIHRTLELVVVGLLSTPPGYENDVPSRRRVTISHGLPQAPPNLISKHRTANPLPYDEAKVTLV